MLKVKAGIKKGDPNLAKTLRRMARIAKKLRGAESLAVGLPKGSQPYPDGTDVLSVGIWNEFGTETIPERAFLREGARQNQKEWLKLARALYKKALREDLDPNQLMGQLGEKMQNDIQASIDSGAWEPNAEPYKSQKAKLGKTKPLIVTGHLRGSIRWVMRKS